MNRYLIAVTTYRRPVELKRLLDSLAALDGLDCADVVVIDNDAAGSAETVVSRHPLPTRYVVEPVPGVVAARNRALDLFDDSYDALTFMDDDGWVPRDWLAEITAFARAHPGEVVRGHVVTHLSADAPAWARRGGMFQRAAWATGTVVPFAITGNALIPRGTWQAAGAPRFDPAFSATGGEDTDFFTGLREAGATIRFCAEAIVHEDVPADRLSVRWVVERAVREGMIDTAVRRRHGLPVAAVILRGVPKSVVLLVALALSLATGRGWNRRAVRGVLFEWGRIRGLFGLRGNAYRASET